MFYTARGRPRGGVEVGEEELMADSTNQGGCQGQRLPAWAGPGRARVASLREKRWWWSTVGLMELKLRSDETTG